MTAAMIVKSFHVSEAPNAVIIGFDVAGGGALHLSFALQPTDALRLAGDLAAGAQVAAQLFDGFRPERISGEGAK